jgi:hypothetical protein
MLLHSCRCIFNYVMFSFCSTQKKRVQNLLEMNLQIYFIKEKEFLYFFLSSLVLARWPNQPASLSLPQAQEGTTPPSPSARQSWPRALLLGPARRPSQRTLPFRFGPLTRGAHAIRHYHVGPWHQLSPTSRRDGWELSLFSPRRKSS